MVPSMYFTTISRPQLVLSKGEIATATVESRRDRRSQTVGGLIYGCSRPRPDLNKTERYEGRLCK